MIPQIIADLIGRESLAPCMLTRLQCTKVGARFWTTLQPPTGNEDGLYSTSDEGWPTLAQYTQAGLACGQFVDDESEFDCLAFASPAPGTRWYHCVDDKTYEVITTTQVDGSEEDYDLLVADVKTGRQTVFGSNVFRQTVSFFENSVVASAPYAPQFRFQSVPKEVWTWAKLWQKVVSRFRRSPLMTHAEIVDCLENNSSAELWVINRARVDGHRPDILFTIPRGPHKEHEECLKIHSTWLPQNALALLPTRRLRDSTRFVRELYKKDSLLVCVRPRFVRSLMKTEAAQEEQKRLDDLDAKFNPLNDLV